MYLYILCVLLCSIETIIVSLCANKDIIIIIIIINNNRNAYLTWSVYFLSALYNLKKTHNMSNLFDYLTKHVSINPLGFNYILLRICKKNDMNSFHIFV